MRQIGARKGNHGEREKRRAKRENKSVVRRSEKIVKKLFWRRAEQDHHGEREETCQKRKENCGENIRVEIEKISVEKSVASSVVHNDTDQGEDPIVEGRQKTLAKYT